ncbi:DUF2336 domain-containing protein [Roseibium sediminis]|uniref:DUF2336 domain-containing protein n=1 Tax=Roseibium sediminis TaxID=1775174 RepID=UPI001FCAB731|nr:DUF2336 domain-containing protein [Roseibium sediminis]
MVINEFLKWVETAPDGPRAEAAGALARAWLHSELSYEERKGATVALTLLLDDPSIDVRKSLAENLARSAEAPPHIIRGLAGDVDEVAEPILRRSPIFSDTELVDLAAEGSERAQVAIAQRPYLSAAVAAALAEVGEAPACAALLDNTSATVIQSAVTRIADRFADHPIVRERLLQRDDICIRMRHKLLLKLAVSLENNPLVQTGLSERARGKFATESGDKVILKLASKADEEQLADFVGYLREEAHLNTRLLLRAVCCGQLRLFVHALSVLGNVPVKRLRETLQTVRPAVLRALLRKAGLPLRSHQAFLMTIDLARQVQADFTRDLHIEQARMLTEYLLEELQDDSLDGNDDIVAFLRNFSVDVARQEARAFMRETSTTKALAAA